MALMSHNVSSWRKWEVQECLLLRRLSGLSGHQLGTRMIAIYEYTP
jgi:hypothetical protein